MKSIFRKTKRKLNRVRYWFVRLITLLSVMVFFVGLSIDWDHTPDAALVSYLLVMGLCLGWLVLVGKANGWYND